MPWEEWERLLPEGPGRIGKDTLHRVHEMKELEAALTAVPWLRKALAALGGEAAADLGRLEEALWREAVRVANRQYYTNEGEAAVLVSFYYLKRDELRGLFSLTQMVRHGRTEEEIGGYLGV
jgi:hypothetical protein